MKTIIEHLDDLDRMIDANNTPKHELRSQVSFIQREVALLQEDNARLVSDYTQLAAEHEKLKAAHFTLQESKRKKGMDALTKASDSYQQMLRSKELRDT